MIVLLAVLILFLGAVCVLFLTPERRLLRFAAAVSPILALAVLLLPIPLPDSFQIAWQPALLFPSPLTFRANSISTSFAVCLCLVLILLEWARLHPVAPTRTARVMSYFLTIGGMIACIASNALAVTLLWGWMDFLTFLAILLLSRSAVVGPQGIVSSVSRSISILSMNFLGTAFILFPVLTRPPAAWSDWNAIWTSQSSGFGIVLFLAGAALRLLVLPTQLSFAQSYTSSTRVDVILRILPPAVMLSFLAGAWPAPAAFPPGSALPFWFFLAYAFLLFWCGLQWWVSVSPYARRDLFLLAAPSLAILAALQGSPSAEIFHAAGVMVILGGGMILLFPGFLPHRRGLAAIPLFLLLAQSGLPATPMFLPVSGLLAGADPTGLILAFLGVIFVMSALIRMAFEPVEAFLMERKPYLFLYLVSVLLAAVFLLIPGWGLDKPLSVPALVFAAVSLLLAGGLSLLARRFQRTGENILHFAEGIFLLAWLRSLFGFLGRKALSFGTAVESLFSGEGAMLWAFALALLLLIILRGG